jgi:hypothetical protein
MPVYHLFGAICKWAERRTMSEEKAFSSYFPLCASRWDTQNLKLQTSNLKHQNSPFPLGFEH